ncbi:transglutaminase family protein [Marinobacterium lutimaris]|uniref:Transglutaminase-like enzyme, putative cysteine protease n=1 Tax=Marinobacterium lutimaris TaxID=568106 RepID=A0A1H5UWZ2_9GAMM|nr:transglutaminase family protein [Marinobacterium lutimaris]SEF79533.1 Transglutaminase-like enzyme, putative cysteine protease [Marinobacterium lutimaris]
MKRYRIKHSTWYGFNGETSLDPHWLRIRPREDHDVRILSATLTLSPPASNVRWYRDVENNSVAVAEFDTPCNEFEILSEVELEHFDQHPLDFLVEDYAVAYPFDYLEEDRVVLNPYFAAGESSEALTQWIANCWDGEEAIQSYGLLRRLCDAIETGFEYNVREEPGVQTPEETLSLGSGSCRDFANLYIAAVRHLGFAARFVSGYLFVPPGPEFFGTTHAWAEVYIPGAGWKGFDPTSGEITGVAHIPVAVARNPESVPPVEGSFLGPEGSTLKVGVWITLLEG